MHSRTPRRNTVSIIQLYFCFLFNSLSLYYFLIVPNSKWSQLTRNEKKTHINRLLDETEINNKQHRDDIYRSILYLAQGVFQECTTHEDYIKNVVENVYLLYECDAFNVFVDILIFEAK